MIETTLSTKQVEALFSENAILFCECDAIPQYRIVELFGPESGRFMIAHMKHDGYLVPGRDWNLLAAAEESTYLEYVTWSGFRKVVSEHNCRLVLQAHSLSKSGKFVDGLWEARRRALDAEDAENARKKRQRKVEHATSRNPDPSPNA